ncbi:MAG: metallophosphoesterase [Myxococcota bacterium]
MWRIAHLSDLHFGARDGSQARIHQGLVKTLADFHLDLLALTGDVFDSSAPDSGVLEGFLTLFRELRGARQTPALVLPGNHDRRDAGVFAPWTGGLFQALKERLAGDASVHVLGTRSPFLVERVHLPGAPFDLIAYDSSYLPEGFVTAGGVVRQEELLQVAAELEGAPERPLLFLLHHHLIPTPVTDTSVIHTAGRPVWQRWLVDNVLPRVVGLGNREELTMTALGAGTALSTLQTLGRAVVVLHGHKHYPTARLLGGLGHDADLLIASAGSCGLAQDWTGGDFEDAPKLWPSINLLEVDAGEVRVKAQAWSPHELGRKNRPRVLASAVREGLRWRARHEDMERDELPPVLASNVARYALSTSQDQLDRLDVEVVRTVEALPAAYLEFYGELVHGPPGAYVTDIRFAGEARPAAKAPHQVRVPLDGQPASWRVVGGALASVAAAEKRPVDHAPFEWVGLVNRSRAAEARLELHLGPVKTKPFASVTDLTTGKEWPAPFTREGDVVSVRVTSCPARRLLRIYWPLER